MADLDPPSPAFDDDGDQWDASRWEDAADAHPELREELRAVLVAGGVTPDQNTLNQLLTALTALFGVKASVLTSGSVPYGIKIGTVVLQWVTGTAFADVPVGAAGQSVSVTWGTAFSTACLLVIPSFEVTAGNSSNWSAAVTAKSTTGATVQIEEWSAQVNPGTLNVLAIGY